MYSLYIIIYVESWNKKITMMPWHVTICLEGVSYCQRCYVYVRFLGGLRNVGNFEISKYFKNDQFPSEPIASSPKSKFSIKFQNCTVKIPRIFHSDSLHAEAKFKSRFSTPRKIERKEIVLFRFMYLFNFPREFHYIFIQFR